MTVDQAGQGDKAIDLMGELFKLMPATAGIMLALIWGLADRTKTAHDVLMAIRIASILLAVSIFAALLGLQAMVGWLHRGSQGAIFNRSQIIFIVGWCGFFGGTVAVIWSLWLI
jgi:hypothetical protein